MSHIIPIGKVQQFLPLHKMDLDTTVEMGNDFPIDHYKIEKFEDTARDIVLAKLSYQVDTAGWFTLDDPPSLVTNIMGMLVAGWVYDRQFAEESTEGSNYGKHKEAEAYRLLEGILTGKYKIDATYLDDPDRMPSTLETEPIMEMESRF